MSPSAAANAVTQGSLQDAYEKIRMMSEASTTAEPSSTHPEKVAPQHTPGQEVSDSLSADKLQGPTRPVTSSDPDMSTQSSSATDPAMDFHGLTFDDWMKGTTRPLTLEPDDITPYDDMADEEDEEYLARLKACQDEKLPKKRRRSYQVLQRKRRRH